MENKIIEINGIKMEIDARTATVKKVDTFKVGDPVKILLKTYSSFEVKFGVIVGFEEFKQRPTITVAYLDYTSIKYIYIHTGTEHEMVAVQEHDLVMEKTWVLDRMKDSIAKKEQELQEEKNKRDLFVKHFGKYFENGVVSDSAITQ